MITRREFACLIGAGCVVAPFVVRAQAATRMRRIGVLVPSSPLTESERADFLRQQLWAPLQPFGWTEGKNIVIESRFANENRDRMRTLAYELARLNVDLIVTYGTEATLAARSATTSIPIVMAAAGDPVATGIVMSLARPGGNITGYSVAGSELVIKKVGLVHELLPKAQRVAVLSPPKGDDPIADLGRQQVDVAYRSLGVQVIFIERKEPTPSSQYESAVAEAVRLRAQALWVPSGRVEAAIRAAIASRLPVIVVLRNQLEAGGLLSFEINDGDRIRSVAAIIDKILRGAKPADIPIEQPTRFRIGVNLRTASALNIAVPQSILLQADPDLVIR